ncbi:site-specific DNA-methyltransferase [Acetobacterium sp. UBA5834]|jgi:DNA modification methylase|uniref:site-specific DNA-methyltransferase n=1 Tax=Acetobacterium sp. UBA5834 TaxID=1945907 RepID=UPI00257D8215|nr:site-specific DNA-methyltransferase [Acetobacterium sp. UBA5834]
MDIQKIPVKKIKHAKYNPRKNLKPGDAEYEKLKRSIKEFGYVEPVIWNQRTGNIVGGHQRFKVLTQLGEKEVDCVVMDMDDEKEKALNVALNKVSGDWDMPLLTDLLKDLDDSGFDLSLTGFDLAEINELFEVACKNDVDEDQFDIDKALEEDSFVQQGDVWLLGRHRLYCGDSTNEEDVKILMDGKLANLCITDPPYACNYTGGTGMKIMNDNLKGEAFYSFLFLAIKNAYNSLADGAAIYIFHSDAEKVNFFNATVNAGFHYSTTCIWVKNALVLGRMDYQMRHEPIIYAFKDTTRHKFYGDRKQTTIWEFDKPSKSKLHPTTKPLPLIAYPMKNSSQTNGIVLDLFGGSGSTLITAEQLDRIAFLMELDPKYASAIVRRYTAYNGDTSDVFVIRNGKKLDCKDIYIPTENDLVLKDVRVDNTQKGRKKGSSDE